MEKYFPDSIFKLLKINNIYIHAKNLSMTPNYE